MTRDEITLLRAARPEAAAYDPEAKARLRARLVVATDGPEPRAARRTRRRFLVAGALTAVAAAGVVAVPAMDLSGPGTPGKPAKPLVLGPVASAASLADNAARTAVAQGPDVMRPGQWGYVKTVLASSSKGVGGSLNGPPDGRMTTEEWRKADGSKVARYFEGRLEVTGGFGAYAYPELVKLPTDPQAMLAEVRRRVAAEGAPVAADERAFQTIEIMMRDVPLPLKTRAALYGALAKQPGVRFEARAADILGRRGVTLYRIDGHIRSEIMVDPKTYAYLGFRFVVVKPHRDTNEHGVERRYKPGQILGWGGAATMAAVERAGDRP
ncbi:CU044_5270 family protein [Actinomadura hibisca]|uniref:CU044_5270 family protein n=1 Tax=Actinomadura hibisca TaxID=68565 RepID=UPI0008318CC7|nr:CU044_5270 family protein [Actinomadura hibisca]